MQSLLVSTDSSDALAGRLGESLEDDGGADMLMVEEEILDDSAVVEAVENVMEVDGLDLEDNDGCVQVRFFYLYRETVYCHVYTYYNTFCH